MLITILIILQYIFLLGLVIILGFLAFVMISFRNLVPFVPTPRKIVREMIDLADIKDKERIGDLGSGSGRIIFAVAKAHKKNLVIGVETSWTLRTISKFFLFFRFFIKRRVQIINQDFFNLDLQQFDVIFCFLTPEALRILAPKFQFLKPGSRLISYMFPLEESSNFKEDIAEVTSKDTIYLYRKIN